MSKNWILSALLLASFTLVSETSWCGSDDDDQVPIGNFFQVDEGIFRGAQPDQAGFEYLRELGIKTIIDLNSDQSVIASERAWAEDAGIHLEYFPLGVFSPPQDSEMNTILSIMSNPRNWPLYVHCEHGRDRTGLVVGLFRVQHDKWNKDEAHQEMLERGFRIFLLPLEWYFWDKVQTFREIFDHVTGVNF